MTPTTFYLDIQSYEVSDLVAALAALGIPATPTTDCSATTREPLTSAQLDALDEAMADDRFHYEF